MFFNCDRFSPIIGRCFDPWFLIKLQPWTSPAPPAQLFFWKFCKIFDNTFLTEHLWATASENMFCVIVSYNKLGFTRMRSSFSNMIAAKLFVFWACNFKYFIKHFRHLKISVYILFKYLLRCAKFHKNSFTENRIKKTTMSTSSCTKSCTVNLCCF